MTWVSAGQALAKEPTLQSVLTELQQKLEAGQSVALDASTLAALESVTAAGTQDNRFGGGKLAVTATINSAGDTTLVTPAPGNRITLWWVTAIADPQATTNPVMAIRLGASEVYRGYAVSHWEIFLGAVNASLIVNLSSGGVNVPVTAHYTEGP